MSHAAHLKDLRDELKTRKLDGFLIPRTDEFQSEFLAPYAERLGWLTGFTGSAGLGVVLADKAYVVTDGRYTLQIKAEVDAKLYQTGDIFADKAADWIADNTKKGMVIGYDSFLHTPAQIEEFEKTLSSKGIELEAVDANPVDVVWKNQPSRPDDKVFLFDGKYAGRTSSEKRDLIAEKIKGFDLDHFIITQPDSIAWLLNIRGCDVAHTPVALSYADIDKAGNVTWYIDPSKVPDDVRAALGNHVTIQAPSQLEKDMTALAAKDQKLGLDYKRSPVWFKSVLGNDTAQLCDITDPVIAPRAAKLPAELDASRMAHKRDGQVLTKFFKWFADEAPKGNLSELDVVDKLLEYRKSTGLLKDTSFETICGWKGNGAIVHYRVTPKTNKAIKGDGILLLDSGGQYEDGTTDITRTVAVGTPTQEQRENFTRVLKGHIALARAVFPEGTTGAQLDTLARQPLWDAGLDFAHGTGHGVGVYLSVHEEAASISGRSHAPLKEGMILSNEPGFYKDGEYGIRIENLVIVKDTGKVNSAGRKMLGFETITLVPLDKSLIEPKLLTTDEQAWLDDYHKAVDDNMKGPDLCPALSCQP